MDETHDIWRRAAGAAYEDLVRSKETALRHLFDEDWKVQAAAISICQFTWRCLADARFVDACRELAATAANDRVRAGALSAFGEALRSSQDASESRFLAGIVTDVRNSKYVRMAAYWALREVQFGRTEEDSVKQMVIDAKEALATLPTGLTEEDAKRIVLCRGRYPESLWETADSIDSDFVNKFAATTMAPVSRVGQTSTAKLDTFVGLISLHKRGVITERELFWQALDWLCESPDDLVRVLDTSPPAVIARFQMWADSHPIDDAGWAAWMNKELFCASPAGSLVVTNEQKQQTRALVEHLRQQYRRST